MRSKEGKCAPTRHRRLRFQVSRQEPESKEEELQPRRPKRARQVDCGATIATIAQRRCKLTAEQGASRIRWYSQRELPIRRGRRRAKLRIDRRHREKELFLPTIGLR